MLYCSCNRIGQKGEGVFRINIKKFVVLIIVVVLLLGMCILSYVNTNIVRENVPTDIVTFYEQYLHLYTVGTYAEIDPYIHYETQEYRDLNREFFKNILYYEIRKWEKINDNLWVATTYVEIDDALGPRMGFHFIGRVDGELKVMPGINNIPEELRDNINGNKYSDKSSLPVDVVVYPIK